MASEGSTHVRALATYLPEPPARSGRGATAGNVTSALREAILDGALTPSTWLREQELAEALGVSRTPVREAIRQLEDEGLIDHIPNRGAVVRTMGLDEVLAVYAVRSSLEGLAARTAAVRRAPELLARLETVQAEMAGAIDGDPRRLAVLNLEFHRAIRESTGNPYLERFLTQVEHAVRRFGTTTYEEPKRARESLAEHREIIDAIEAGDAEQAERAAMHHMHRARDARLADLLHPFEDAAGANERTEA